MTVPSPEPAAAASVGASAAGPVRRKRWTRAFENKRGGWTLISAACQALDLEGPAALCLWEGLERGGTPEELAGRLADRFPDVDRERLRLDTLAFLESLDALGVLEAGRARA
ncbi:MAG: PqqD family protein [Candidatus Eisenbacteria bacterium]